MPAPLADILEALDGHARPIINWRELYAALEREQKRVERLREAMMADNSPSGMLLAAGIAGYADGMREIAGRIQDRIIDGGFA